MPVSSMNPKVCIGIAGHGQMAPGYKIVKTFGFNQTTNNATDGLEMLTQTINQFNLRYPVTFVYK
ncbi:MAG: hypothetical protein JWP81_5185 [Ferruginibacter sp.]|nr:hypothetical protein [Ferruginibacter sp.]